MVKSVKKIKIVLPKDKKIYILIHQSPLSIGQSDLFAIL